MSAVYGVWKYAGKGDNSLSDIGRLQNWNKAYGEASEKMRIENNICMGCFLEKLSDTAAKTAPILKADGKYAVIDALIYNRDELIEKGQFGESLSDEELLWACTEKWGYESLREVNGDFAGVVYDNESHEITLFRDHMGIRPLFYYADGEMVAFSTDIRGLTSMSCVDVSVNEEWVWNTIAGTVYMGVENTEFAKIFCVKPASYVQFHLDDGALRQTGAAYWEIGKKKIRYSTEEKYINKMRELITDAVNIRLGAVSGPVGAELSGGLDSSVIDILINRAGREGIYYSWSASPKEIPLAEEDERITIEDICKQEKISCCYGERGSYFNEKSIINDKMRDMGYEPDFQKGFFLRYAFPPYMNTLKIARTSQYVREHGGKVVFTGHGGDEGVSHRSNPYELFFHKEYLHYLQYMWDSTKGERKRLYKLFLRCRKNLLVTRKALRSPYVTRTAAKDLLSKDFFEKYNTGKGIPLTFAYDPRTYIVDGGSRNRLDVTALLGAYSGARYVVPYLDYRVVDFAVSIPRHMFLKKKMTRYIFREAFKDIMPESLYCLNSKEDTSWKNAQKPENDAERDIVKEEEEYLAGKRQLLGMLDREYWGNYLNWGVFEQWADIPKAEMDKDRAYAVMTAISNCLGLQSMIAVSREIPPAK